MSHIANSRALTPSADLYKADGDIILSSIDKTAFKVHKAQLVLHSEVFRDMFDTPGAYHEGDTMDGCPVVVLQDRSEGLAFLLQVFYKTRQLSVRNAGFVLNVFELANKYVIDTICAQALSIMNQWFPGNLEAWDYLKAAHPGHTAHRLENVIRSIRLARFTNHNITLPTAFYVLAFHPIKDIILTVSDPDDLTILMTGRSRASHRTTIAMLQIVTPVRGKRCADNNPIGESTCQRSLDAVRSRLTQILRSGPFERRIQPRFTATDPIGCVREVKKWIEDGGVCSACRKEHAQRCEKVVDKIWSCIPWFFDMEGSQADVESWANLQRQNSAPSEAAAISPQEMVHYM